MKKYISIVLILILSLFTLISPLYSEEKESLVDEIKYILYEHYVEPVPKKLLEQKTVEDVLNVLNDPYTKYFNEKEFREFWFSLEGKFGGIGVVIDKTDNNVIVTKVIPNTPASRVNIQVGDILTHVNNQSLTNLSMEEIKDLFRGKPGTYLRFRTYRPESKTALTYLLAREYIKINTVESTILTKNIGYIKINEFNQETAEEFLKNLTKLKKENVKGLILDLRDNPGGLIGAVLDISREILPPGPLVKLVYRGEKPKIISTIGTEKLLPLIILVNKNTASSAEILAGAIQDRNSGILLGTNTYGKASVQSLVPLKNGGALKFTSGKYLTPKNKQINKIGLTPDFYVKDPQNQILAALWMLENKIHKSITYQVNNPVFLINGKSQESPVKPFLHKGRFMIPLRSTIENLGGKISFSPPDKIYIKYNNYNLNFRLNTSYYILNGEKKYFSVKPILKSDFTMVPVRMIGELINTKIHWRPGTGQVILTP